MMTNRLKSVLSRTLSTEIGNQLAWRMKDMANGLPYEDRDEVIKEIRQFMDVNDIDVNQHYVIEGKLNA